MGPFRSRTTGSSRLNRLAPVPILAIVFLALPGASQAGTPLAPGEIIAPAEPAVKPSIPVLLEIDTNLDKIDDALEARVIALENARANLKAAPSLADEHVPVEFVFSAQVGQDHLDQFVKLGGQVTYIYESVSYGWNGILPLSLLRDAVRLAGPTLVGVVQSRRVQLHLDKATRAGRVRPYVWDAGYDGNSNITIAIMDTGVDDSHTDLAGRMEYWKDYTTDASPTPVCMVAHGSHVAGIALGTGAGSGVNPTVIKWTDQGTFPSSNGYFYPAPHEIPAGVTRFDWTTNMIWQTGGGASAQHSQATVNASTFAYTVLFTPIVSSSSPIGATTSNNPNPFSGYLRLYTSFNSSSSAAGGRAYSTANTATADVGNFGVGDSYNLFRGVAPGCRWAGAKVFPNNGQGASSLDINAALDDMVNQRVAHNIKVINMSFGLASGQTDPTERAKVNTAADNGIVVSVSAGNDGPAGEIADPARAAKALTVGSANDINQLTDYTSIWTDVPASTEDYKPDLLAPGGTLTAKYSKIMSVDSNDADAVAAGVAGFADQVANDYLNIAGTSMASPFVTGCAALVIDAWQSAGHTWNFYSSADPLFVKMLLCASATETNQTRESGTNNPTLERASNNPTTGKNKDTREGYGMINADAAVDALTLALASQLNDSLGSTPTDRRAAGRFVDLTAGLQISLTLSGMTGGDYDLYVYDSLPDAKGNPVILASSTNAGINVNESLSFTPASTRRAYVLVKRVSGSGAFTLSYCVGLAAPTGVSASDGLYCDKVQVNWNTVSGATEYKVYRSTSDLQCPEPPMGTVTTPPYDDYLANPGTIYYYSVKASNACGDSTCSSTDSGYRKTVPSAPTGVAASDGTYCDKVRVTWNAVSGATGYKVYRSTSDVQCPEPPIVTVTTTSYDDTSDEALTLGTSYFYSVKATNSCGESSCSNTDRGYACDLQIVSWESVKTHTAPAGSPPDVCGNPPVELGITLDATAAADPNVTVETRVGGISTIVVTFNRAPLPPTGTVSAVSAKTSSSIPATGQGVVGNTLRLNWEPPLPNQDCYTIDLAGLVPYLTGDTDCRVKALTGDVDRGGVGMGNLTIGDAIKVNSYNGNNPCLLPQYREGDIDLNGTITIGDAIMANTYNGNRATCP